MFLFVCSDVLCSDFGGFENEMGSINLFQISLPTIAERKMM
jgi:hypothetical protein